MRSEHGEGTQRQRALLDRWVASLAENPAVEVIWLEGSFVDDRANPWSDIDLRVAIADGAYGELWEGDRAPLLQGLGEYLLLWTLGFVRAVTAEGVVAELGARRSSELDGLELYEWRLLLDRRPEGPPRFRKLPMRSAAEAWPGSPVTPEDVNRRTKLILLNLAIVAQDFYRQEVLAAAYTLYYLRHELFEVMYQRLGIRIGKRNKELSQIFPPEFIADLENTYTREGERALDLRALAAAQLRTFAALGKHFQVLSDQVGGGFEPEWFHRLYERTEQDLRQFM